MAKRLLEDSGGSHDLKAAFPKPEAGSSPTDLTVLGWKVVSQGGGLGSSAFGQALGEGEGSNRHDVLSNSGLAGGSNAGGSSYSATTRVAYFMSNFNLIELELSPADLARSDWSTRHRLLAIAGNCPGLEKEEGKNSDKTFRSFARRWNVAEKAILDARSMSSVNKGTEESKNKNPNNKFGFVVVDCSVSDNLTVVCLVEDAETKRQGALICHPKNDVLLAGDSSKKDVQVQLDAYKVNYVPIIARANLANTNPNTIPAPGGGTGWGRADGLVLHPNGATMMLFHGTTATPAPTSDLPAIGISLSTESTSQSLGISSASTSSRQHQPHAQILATSFLAGNEQLDYWMLTSDGSMRFHVRARLGRSFVSKNAHHIDPSALETDSASSRRNSPAKGSSVSPSRERNDPLSRQGTSISVRDQDDSDTRVGRSMMLGQTAFQTSATKMMGVSVAGAGEDSSFSKTRPSFQLNGGKNASSIPVGEGVHRQGKTGYIRVRHPGLAAAIEDANLMAGERGRSRGSLLIAQSPNSACTLLVFPLQFVAFKVLPSVAAFEGRSPSCFDIIQEIPLPKSEGVPTSILPDGDRGFILIRSSSTSSNTVSSVVKGASEGPNRGSTVKVAYVNLAGEIRSLGQLNLASQVLVDPKSKVGHVDPRNCLPLGTTLSGSHLVTLEPSGTIAKAFTLPLGLELLLLSPADCEGYIQSSLNEHINLLFEAISRRLNAGVAIELSKGQRRLVGESSSSLKEDVPKTAFIPQPPLGPVYEILANTLGILSTLLLEALEFTPLINLPGDELMMPEEEEDALISRKEELTSVVSIVVETIEKLASLPVFYTFEEKCLFVPVFQLLLSYGAVSSCWAVATGLDIASFYDSLLPAVIELHQLRESVLPRCSRDAQSMLQMGMRLSRTLWQREHDAKHAPPEEKPKSVEEIEKIVASGELDKLSLLDGFELGYSILTTKGPGPAAAALKENFTKHPGCMKELIAFQERLEKAVGEIPHM